jgi:plastocyanin
MNNKWRIAVWVSVVAVLVAACGSAASASPTTAPAAAPAGAAGQIEVAISGFAFDPPSLTVAVGTTVNWTNQDSARHTVTSDAGDWGSGQLGNGETWGHTFAEVGTFAYHCADHPSMTATIQVSQ